MNFIEFMSGRAYLISSLLGVVVFVAGWKLWPEMSFPVALAWGLAVGLLTALAGRWLDKWIGHDPK